MLRIGIVSPLVALLCIAVAIPLSPWFTWFGNALSDLGNYNNGVAVAILFNSGLVITGLSALLFTVWFLTKTESPPTKIGLFVFAVSDAFLVLVGILSENAGRIHFIVSVGFFATFPFAMWIVGADFLRFSKTRPYALPSLLLPFVSLYFWYITFGGTAPWSGVAIPEIVTALTAIGWLYLLCSMVLTNTFPEQIWGYERTSEESTL